MTGTIFNTLNPTTPRIENAVDFFHKYRPLCPCQTTLNHPNINKCQYLGDYLDCTRSKLASSKSRPSFKSATINSQFKGVLVAWIGERSIPTTFEIDLRLQYTMPLIQFQHPKFVAVGVISGQVRCGTKDDMEMVETYGFLVIVRKDICGILGSVISESQSGEIVVRTFDVHDVEIGNFGLLRFPSHLYTWNRFLNHRA